MDFSSFVRGSLQNPHNNPKKINLLIIREDIRIRKSTPHIGYSESQGLGILPFSYAYAESRQVANKGGRGSHNSEYRLSLESRRIPARFMPMSFKGEYSVRWFFSLSHPE